jgi:hypothetical protein
MQTCQTATSFAMDDVVLSKYVAMAMPWTRIMERYLWQARFGRYQGITRKRSRAMESTRMASKLESIKDEVSVQTAPDQRIRERAYQIWQRAGQPDGQAVANWTQAEQELRDIQSVGERDYSRVLQASR